jgi:MerR family transcriptional regulator, copper efflux regulator
MKRIDEYMSIKQAAEFLGVTANTLRNWERASKVKVCRNPLNHYRLYDREDLEQLLKTIRESHESHHTCSSI